MYNILITALAAKNKINYLKFRNTALSMIRKTFLLVKSRVIKYKPRFNIKEHQ